MSCSRAQHTAAGVRTVYLCIQNRHSSQPTNILNIDNLNLYSVGLQDFFYDHRPPADLRSKIEKSLKLDSLQHSIANYRSMNVQQQKINFVNIAIPPVLDESVKSKCHSHIQSIHSYIYKYHSFVRDVRLWNIILYHLATKLSIESTRFAAFQWILRLQRYKHPDTNNNNNNNNNGYF